MCHIPHSLLGHSSCSLGQPLTEQGHFTALKGHSVNVKGPPCLATAASTAPAPLPGKAGNPQPGLKKGRNLQPGLSPPGALEGREGKSTLTLEREGGWRPAQFHQQKPHSGQNLNLSWWVLVAQSKPRSLWGSCAGMGQGTSMQDTSMGMPGRWGCSPLSTSVLPKVVPPCPRPLLEPLLRQQKKTQGTSSA